MLLRPKGRLEGQQHLPRGRVHDVLDREVVEVREERLAGAGELAAQAAVAGQRARLQTLALHHLAGPLQLAQQQPDRVVTTLLGDPQSTEIGRAWCRERLRLSRRAEHREPNGETATKN